MDDNTLLAILVFSPIILGFLVPGIIFLILARQAATKRKRCTLPVGVRCIKMEEHYFHKKANDSFSGREMAYRPTFIGNINGKDIEFQPKYFSPSLYNDINVGSRTDIMVNPGNYKEWVMAINEEDSALDKSLQKDEIGLTVLATIFLACTVFISYLFAKTLIG